MIDGLGFQIFRFTITSKQGLDLFLRHVTIIRQIKRRFVIIVRVMRCFVQRAFHLFQTQCFLIAADADATVAAKVSVEIAVVINASKRILTIFPFEVEIEVAFVQVGEDVSFILTVHLIAEQFLTVIAIAEQVIVEQQFIVQTINFRLTHRDRCHGGFRRGRLGL